MLQSTLCYLERGDAYLMLHRVKKEHDANRDKWIGIGRRDLRKLRENKQAVLEAWEKL